jgi:cytoskeletal protein CcmA (bactofilin family)
VGRDAERRYRMINRKKDNDGEIKAFLGKGAEFNGKLVLNGLVRIDGEFKGEALGSGTLIIGEGAYVEADIAVDSILISGEVRGNLNIREKTEISSTGKLLGNMKTSNLVVKEGAIIDGACQMSDTDRGEYAVTETDE